MNKTIRGLLMLGVLFFALACTACSYGNGYRINSTHFAYPNSNVVPLGEVEGSSTRLCGLLFINWGSAGGDDVDSAIEDAMHAEAGADLLINADVETGQFYFPYLFSTCYASVRGTAARMEVGRQELSVFEQNPTLSHWVGVPHP